MSNVAIKKRNSSISDPRIFPSRSRLYSTTQEAPHEAPAGSPSSAPSPTQKTVQPLKLTKAMNAKKTSIFEQRPLTAGLAWLNRAFSTLGTASWDNSSSVLDETKLAQFFDKYDEDRSGAISCTKLQAALHLESNGHFTDTDFSTLLDMSARAYNHWVDLAEFRRLLLRTNSYSRPFGTTRECLEVDWKTTNQHVYSKVVEASAGSSPAVVVKSESKRDHEVEMYPMATRVSSSDDFETRWQAAKTSPPGTGNSMLKRESSEQTHRHHLYKSASSRYRTNEDKIANQVLWLALITHAGKLQGSSDNVVTKRCVFAPQGPFRTYWDSVSMLFIIYVIVITPMQVAFMAPPMMETSLAASGQWSALSGCGDGQVPCFNYWGIFWMDLVIDIFFTADIAVNFRSAWIDTDPYSPSFKSINYSCKKASIRYFKGMFFIDVLSVLPFFLWDLSPLLARSGTLLRVPRLLRLAKLIKLFRVFRASRVYRRWEKAITKTCSSSAAMLIELTVVLIVSVHFMGCIWFLIASLNIGYDEEYRNKYGDSSTSTTDSILTATTPNTTTPVALSLPREWWEDSWIINVPGYQSGSIQEMYLASISFSLATITGGNIDILPVIFSERVTAFMCMVIGVLVFAYVLGQVTLLIASLTMRRNQFLVDMSTLQTYLRSYPFAKATRTRAIDYFYYTYHSKQYAYDSEARRKTISHFSPFLQRSLAYAELRRFLIGTCHEADDLVEHRQTHTYPDPLPFLRLASHHIIKDLCSKLTFQIYGPIEIVAHQGGPCTKMFTLDNGCMCRWTNLYDEVKESVQLAHWKYVTKGIRFGTDSLLLALDNDFSERKTSHITSWFQSYQTLTFCDFICLAAKDFARILRRYPKQARGMRKDIIRAKFRRMFHLLARMSKTALKGLRNPVKVENHTRPKLKHVAKQLTALRNENSALKVMVQGIQDKLAKQRSAFDQDLHQQLSQQRVDFNKRLDQMMLEQRQQLAEQRSKFDQRMRQTMDEHRDLMARQHQELMLALALSSK